MAKILITGAAGYLGAQTTVDFIKTGHEVIAVDNYLNSDPVSYRLISEITGSKPVIYNVDLADHDAVNSIFSKHRDIEAVIHFAALKSVPESVAKPLFCFQNNNAATVNLLHACEKYEVEHFVFSSSCSVYGDVSAKDLPVDENTPLKTPASPYGYTKQNGEYLIECQTRVTPLKACALRYFNPVGAHPSGNLGELPAKRVNNLVPLITQKAAGIIDSFTVFGSDYNTHDGSCIRDYIHVSDIARAHLNAFELLKSRSEPSFEVINLGSGKGVSVFEMITAYEEATGQNFEYSVGKRRAGDVEAIFSNPQKALKLLNWKPELSLLEVMESAHKWQQKLISLGLGTHKLG